MAPHLGSKISAATACHHELTLRRLRTLVSPDKWATDMTWRDATLCAARPRGRDKTGSTTPTKAGAWQPAKVSQARHYDASMGQECCASTSPGPQTAGACCDGHSARLTFAGMLLKSLPWSASSIALGIRTHRLRLVTAGSVPLNSLFALVAMLCSVSRRPGSPPLSPTRCGTNRSHFEARPTKRKRGESGQKAKRNVWLRAAD